MPKRRRRSSVPTQVWHQERHGIGSRFLGRSTQFYAMVGVVVLMVLAVGLVVYAFGSNWLEDRNRPGSTAIQVGDAKYSVRYYSERLRQYVAQIGGPESQVAQNPQFAMQIVSEEIEEEAILLNSAEELGVTASDDEIKAQIATNLSLTGPDDPTYEGRYQQDLAASNVSEAQYRDRMRAEVLKRKVKEKFTAEVPATAESVHYRELIAADQAEADAIVARVQGGEDFVQIATEKGSENGGDAGWAPRGSLDTAREEKLFALEPGGLATFQNGEQFLVFQVLEKQPDRPVEEEKKTAISDNTYAQWRDEKRDSLTVSNSVTSTGCDAKKVKWALDRAVPNVNNDLISESLCA